MDDSRAKQKLMAEMMRRGATLLREPCAECGGILLRFRGRDVCPTCSGITSMEELEQAATPRPEPPKGRMEVVAKVLDETLALLARERDPARRVKLLEVAKLSAELLKLLKD